MAKNRAEMEKLIVAKVQEIYRLYREYNPNGDMLSMSASGDFICVNNQYWKEDKERPIDAILNEKGFHSRNH